MSFKDTLLGLLIIFIWGINFVVIVWGLDGLPPLLMGALRFALVFLVGFLFVKKPDIPLKWMAAYGLLLSFGQFALLFSAMALGMPAGLASLVLQSQALFTLIFAALLLKEQVKVAQLLAMLVAGVGLYTIASTNQNSTMTGIGFGLTIIGASLWGLGNIINRVISNKGYKPGLDLVIWSAWIPIIPFLISSYFIEGPELIIESMININWESFLALCYLAIGASIIGYSLWSYLLSRYPAGQVAPLTLGVPIVGISASAFFLGETITSTQWIGSGLVLVGLMINAFGERVGKKLRVRKLGA
jgi:drug/metabolite transporter (DMT)-like permease